MKTYVITGAGHFPGIGSSTALKLLTDHRVIVNSRTFDQRWQDLQTTHPDRLILVPGNIVDESVQLTIKDVVEKFKSLHGLVNNASTGAGEFVNNRLTRKCWQENFEVNVIAAYELGELLHPFLKNGRGSIVNVSTRSSLQPGGNNMAYAVSKAALNHLTRQQAMMYAPEVTVNAVCPGFVDSYRLQNILGSNFQTRKETFRNQVLIQDLIDPNQIADTILHLMSANQITGQLLPICGGSTIQPKL